MRVFQEQTSLWGNESNRRRASGRAPDLASRSRRLLARTTGTETPEEIAAEAMRRAEEARSRGRGALEGRRRWQERRSMASEKRPRSQRRVIRSCAGEREKEGGGREREGKATAAAAAAETEKMRRGGGFMQGGGRWTVKTGRNKRDLDR